MAIEPSAKRILFISEAVTLAHVARPAALASTLDPQRHEIVFACDPRVRHLITLDDAHVLPLPSIGTALFADRLRRGAPAYERRELETYVHADRELIDAVRPDLIVGDFRLSLSVSARLAAVRYACIANAYWSPWATDRSLPLPVLPWTGRVPLAIAQHAFNLIQPLALARHCRPLNTLRVAHGLPPLPADIRHMYTDADDTLYADSPTLFPTPGCPDSHRHIGPVLWSPPLPDPPWWDELAPDQPVVYVTMGSSGRVGHLDHVFDGLAALGVQVVASTAGAASPSRHWDHVRVAGYLPGQKAAARSALVVCNGGSPTAQQALAAGRPVLGICTNMDQLLNMRGLVAAGLGIALRADRLTTAGISAAAARLLECRPAPARAASEAAAALCTPRRFADFVASRLQ